MGIETGVDLDAVVDTGRFISDALGRPPASRVARAMLAKRGK
jgi:isopropylmalate/homocitrate/citramalate synthase